MKIELDDDDLKAALEMWLPTHVFKASVKVEKIAKSTYGTSWDVEISRGVDVDVTLGKVGVKP